VSRSRICEGRVPDGTTALLAVVDVEDCVGGGAFSLSVAWEEASPVV
jgi:hypothetical protein